MTTVADLIRQLQALPSDMPVFVYGQGMADGFPVPVGAIEVIDIGERPPDPGHTLAEFTDNPDGHYAPGEVRKFRGVMLLPW